jgi:FkbM family methyltransferase
MGKNHFIEGFRRFLVLRIPAPLAVRLRSIFGQSQEIELKFLKTLVKPGDRVLDIGANRGTYTYPLSKLVGIHGKVIAFEPLPDYYKYLKDAFDNKKNVEVHNLALSDQAGETVLYLPFLAQLEMPGYATLEKITGQFKELIIKTQTLDSLEIKDIDFIKIDIEGHEYNFLLGALATLKNSWPILQIELNSQLNSLKVKKAIQLLTQTLDYSVFKFDGKSLISVDISSFSNSHVESKNLAGGNYIFIRFPEK